MEESNQRMDNGTQVLTAPTEEAHEWLQYSLRQGFDISSGVLAASVFEQGQFLAIVSDKFQRIPFKFSQGGVLGQRPSKERLALLLTETFPTAKSILIEDELRGRNDPYVAEQGQPAAFIGDRVIHWCDLSRGVEAAVEAIVKGAWGYPTNVFVLAKSSAELGLVDREDAPKNLVEEAMSSLRGVVVSAFDDESYLIWVPKSKR